MIASCLEFYPIREYDRQLGHDFAPVAYRKNPALGNIRLREPQELQERFIMRKHRGRLGHLTELPVEIFYRIGGVDHLADSLRVREERHEIFPAVLLVFEIGLVVRPAFADFAQRFPSSILSEGAV